MASTRKLKTAQQLLGEIVAGLTRKGRSALKNVAGELENVVAELNQTVRSKASKFAFKLSGPEWEIASSQERKSGIALKVPYFTASFEPISSRELIGHFPVKIERIPGRMYRLVAVHERSAETHTQAMMGDKFNIRKDKAQCGAIFEMARYLRGRGPSVQGAEGVGIPVVIETDHFGQMVEQLREDRHRPVADGMLVEWESEKEAKGLLLRKISQRLTVLELQKTSEFSQKEARTLNALKARFIRGKIGNPEQLYDELFMRYVDPKDSELQNTLDQMKLADRRLTAAQDAAADAIFSSDNPDLTKHEAEVERALRISKGLEESYDRRAPDVLRALREDFLGEKLRLLVSWEPAR